MKKPNLILISGILAVILIFSYCHFRKGGEEHTPAVDPETMGSVPAEDADAAKQAAQNNPSETSTTPAPGFLPTQMEDPGKFEAIQKNLKEMAHCLNMQMGHLDAQSELNFETFNRVISPDLGDVVTQNEEWTATDIRTKSGELRRIFIQNSPDMETESARTLKYYAISQDGSKKELPLSKEQMGNPSEALIASLESDGELMDRSLSRRIFYQNGDDLLLVEKNGKIFSFELPHDGKVFNCQDVDSAQMKCTCR